MGNTVASTEGADPEESKRWFFENILFFDPAPAEEREDWDEERNGTSGPRVKRFTPSNAKLCNRNFLIHFTFNGKAKEYILKLQNQPHCRMLLCDKAGELIKEIRTNRVKHIQRQGMAVEVFVRRDRQELSSFTFAFDSITECDLFCEFVKMLFGIQVYQVGVSPLQHFIPPTEHVRHHVAPEEETSSSEDENAHRFPMHSPRNYRQRKKRESTATQPRTGCPVHRNTPCRCNVERPILGNPDGESSSEDDVHEVDAVRSEKFPVVIEGVCEAGSILTMRDVAVRQLNKPPPRVVEWFRSKLPGKDPTFPRSPVKTGVSFRLSEEDVGHHIQLRVLRRLSSTAADPFVYSLAMKGPVTVNSATAKGMLQYLSQNEVTLEALLDKNSLLGLFNLPDVVSSVRPFFDCTVTLKRDGLRFESKVKELNQRLMRELRGLCFYVVRPASQDIDLREDNLVLLLHVVNYNARTCRCVEKVVSLRMPSEAVRDHFFHTLRLRRLSAKMPSFERWATDLETGNFTSIKQYYARTWEECTWEQYVDFKKAEQFLLFEQNTGALPVSQALGGYGGSSEAAAVQYVPIPAATGYRGPGPDYGMVPSPAEGKASPAKRVHQTPQGASERASVSAAVATASSPAEAMAGASARAPGSRPGGGSMANIWTQQYAVVTAVGERGTTVSAAAVAPRREGPVPAAVAGGERAGGSAKAVSGRPPAGATAAAAPVAKDAQTGAPPTQVAAQRVNNYALYAELYRGMNMGGQAQKTATGAEASSKGPQANRQPTAKAKAVPPSKSGVAAESKARQEPQAAPAAVAKSNPRPKSAAAAKANP